MFSYSVNSSRLSTNDTGRLYPDPFLTHSTRLMPKTMEEALNWSEQLWMRNGTYARAMKRVIAYFITKIQVTEASDQEKQKYEKFLNTVLNVPVVLSQLGADLMAYGNSFSSIYVPFKRMLRCDKCNVEVPIEKVDFELDGKRIKWSCGHCKREILTEKPIDRRINDESQIRVKRWSPHQIKIMEHPISGDCIYLWDPPANVCKKIKEGDPFYIRYFPWEMVEAILDDKMFEFGPRVIFHMREEQLAGIELNGWGLSQSINNFGQAYYVQMAKLYNEVLMQDYIIPFRVVTPSGAATKTGSDPLLSVNVGQVNSKLTRLFAEHRKNPGGWHALPFDVNYQLLGGEGLQLSTYEHIGAAMDELLNASGVPAELYKGTVSFQALPTALRLFQSTWPHLVSQFNDWLDWLMETLATVFNWDRSKAELQPVTLADDIEKRNIVMQLMAGQQISRQTALAPLGIDAEEEIDRILNERREQIDKETEFNMEQQQKQMMQEQFAAGGQAAMMPGGQQYAQQGMGQPASVTPDDMMLQAEQEAQRLLGMPYEQRRSEMIKLKKSNETLHSLVKAKMEEIRTQADSIGGYQMLQTMLPQQQGMM